MGDLHPHITWFLGPTVINSAVFEGLSVVTNVLTDKRTMLLNL